MRRHVEYMMERDIEREDDKWARNVVDKKCRVHDGERL